MRRLVRSASRSQNLSNSNIRAGARIVVVPLIGSLAGLGCNSDYSPGYRPGVAEREGKPDNRDAGPDAPPDMRRDTTPKPDADAGPLPDVRADVRPDAPRDAGRDVPPDVRPDIGHDAPRDMGRDMPPDVRPDIGHDAPRDAGRDVGRDMPPDVRPDIGHDAPRDMGRDVGPDVGPDMGPDGGIIPVVPLRGPVLVFASTRNNPDPEEYRIFLKNLATGEVGQVTQDPAEIVQDRAPIMCQEGSFILFHSDRQDGMNKIYRVNPNGTGLVALTEGDDSHVTCALDVEEPQNDLVLFMRMVEADRGAIFIGTLLPDGNLVDVAPFLDGINDGADRRWPSLTRSGEQLVYSFKSGSTFEMQLLEGAPLFDVGYLTTAAGSEAHHRFPALYPTGEAVLYNRVHTAAGIWKQSAMPIGWEVLAMESPGYPDIKPRFYETPFGEVHMVYAFRVDGNLHIFDRVVEDVGIGPPVNMPVVLSEPTQRTFGAGENKEPNVHVFPE